MWMNRKITQKNVQEFSFIKIWKFFIWLNYFKLEKLFSRFSYFCCSREWRKMWRIPIDVKVCKIFQLIFISTEKKSKNEELFIKLFVENWTFLKLNIFLNFFYISSHEFFLDASSSLELISSWLCDLTLNFSFISLFHPIKLYINIHSDIYIYLYFYNSHKPSNKPNKQKKMKLLNCWKGISKDGDSCCCPD